MPAGMAAILLAAPFLLDGVGWRGTWMVMAAVSLAWALFMLVAFGRAGKEEGARQSAEAPWRNL